ncbi:MAG: hypothetical protein MUP82_06320, partial [Candidatus Marinimicrobia bacterium]|nr:hypothetical protein [Candidatus Neomarinimicrobiota bacterium]
MKVRYKSTIIILLFSTIIFSEDFDSIKNQISLNIEGDRIIIKDQQASSLAYRAFKLCPIHVSYKNHKTDKIIYLDIFRGVTIAQSKNRNKSNIIYNNFRLSFLQATKILKKEEQSIFGGITWENRSI